MGGSIPIIYTALETMQTKYQIPVIAVKGKIDNHPITFLIDSGASHSYIL
jgi:hypothetical protein